MKVGKHARLVWIGLTLAGAAACLPIDEIESPRPISWWEGDALTNLRPSEDPDGARFELALGDLEVGSTARGTIRVRNTGAGALEIASKALPEAVVVQVPGPIEAFGRADVLVSVTPLEPGAIRYVFDLKTNDPIFANVRFRVVGRAVTSSDPDDPDVEDPDDPEDPGTVDPEDPTDPGTDDPDEPGDDDPSDPGGDPADPGDDDPTSPEPACGEHSDAFVAERKTDVLWVIDNSGVVPYYGLLSPNWSEFVSAAGGVDFHVGVTTTGLFSLSPGSGCWGGANGGENGRLFPVDGNTPRIISSSMPAADQAAAWFANADVGECHFDEQPYEAARRALSSPLVDHADDPSTQTPNDGNLGFLRPDADLAIVFITDERDQSVTWGFTVPDYVAFFQSLKPGLPEKVTLHVIAGERGGPTPQCWADQADRLLDGVAATGGTSHSLCTPYPDWPDMLQALSRGVFDRVGATFRLSAEPGDVNADGVVNEGDVIVRLDGSQLAPTNALGDTVWSLDAVTNTLRFEPSYVPASGVQVEILYVPDCLVAAP